MTQHSVDSFSAHPSRRRTVSRRQVMLGAILLTTVNLAYYQELMANIRAAIAAGHFGDLRATISQTWARCELPLVAQ